MIRFSIITCTYNSEKYIGNNIRSVSLQTFQNYEHIFIDAFSTDKTIGIIKKYQKSNPSRIKLFQYPKKGISDAMNIGIKKAQGEYLIFLHSDDIFYTNDILQYVNDFIIKKNSPSWIYGRSNFLNIITNKKRIVPHRKIYYKANFWLLLLTDYIPHQATFIKKEIFNKYGYFDTQLLNAMDYEMWLRLTKNNISSCFINKIICTFTMRPGSQSNIGQINSLNEKRQIQQRYIKNKILLKLIFFINKISSFRKFQDKMTNKIN